MIVRAASHFTLSVSEFLFEYAAALASYVGLSSSTCVAEAL